MEFVDICDECHKLASRKIITYISPDVRTGRPKLVYCNKCITSITYKKIQEKAKEFENLRKTKIK